MSMDDVYYPSSEEQAAMRNALRKSVKKVEVSMSMDFEAANKEFELAEYERADRSVGLPEGYSLGLSPMAYAAARHALSAMAAVQSGEWKLVPVEPTKEMIDEIDSRCDLVGEEMSLDLIQSNYKAMLNASPDLRMSYTIDDMVLEELQDSIKDAMRFPQEKNYDKQS